MPGSPKRLAGPAYLSTSAADVLTTPSSGQMYEITHIHVANEDSSARTFDLYIGGTGGSTGGTSIYKGKSVPANDGVDWYSPGLVMKNGDYLSGLASSASKLAITVIGRHSIIP